MTPLSVGWPPGFSTFDVSAPISGSGGIWASESTGKNWLAAITEAVLEARIKNSRRDTRRRTLVWGRSLLVISAFRSIDRDLKAVVNHVAQGIDNADPQQERTRVGARSLQHRAVGAVRQHGGGGREFRVRNVEGVIGHSALNQVHRRKSVIGIAGYRDLVVRSKEIVY